MTDPAFYTATDANGSEFILYGRPDRPMERGTFDVIVARHNLDLQNRMLWRRVVAGLTGVWPECTLPICDHDNRRHEGECRTFIGMSFGGGPDA